MDFTRLTQFLDSLPARGIPGCDCVVYFRHQPVYRHSAGYADVGEKRPIRPHTLYNLYSASKVITCTAALQLFEQGRFLMSDPLAEYLPEFRDMQVKLDDPAGRAELRPAARPIRMLDLFTMSAGLTYNLVSPSIRRLQQDSAGLAPTREVARAIADEPLIFEPGTHWNYSLCHDVLGAVIEVLSGMRFGAYLEQNLFQPVGMTETGFGCPPGQLERMASQYRFDESDRSTRKIGLDNPYVLGSAFESGGAGLVSSVEDYGLFVETLCNGGRTATGEQILCRRTIDLMRTNQLDDVRLADFNWIQMSGYGYGLGVRTLIDKAGSGSLSSPGEFGWGGAAGAYVLVDPDSEVAVFYAQHMLNSLEPYVHPRLRNLIYRCLN